MKRKRFLLINLLFIFILIIPAGGLAVGWQGADAANIYLPLVLNKVDMDVMVTISSWRIPDGLRPGSQ